MVDGLKEPARAWRDSRGYDAEAALSRALSCSAEGSTPSSFVTAPGEPLRLLAFHRSHDGVRVLLKRTKYGGAQLGANGCLKTDRESLASQGHGVILRQPWNEKGNRLIRVWGSTVRM